MPESEEMHKRKVRLRDEFELVHASLKYNTLLRKLLLILQRYATDSILLVLSVVC